MFLAGVGGGIVDKEILNKEKNPGEQKPALFSFLWGSDLKTGLTVYLFDLNPKTHIQ